MKTRPTNRGAVNRRMDGIRWGWVCGAGRPFRLASWGVWGAASLAMIVGLLLSLNGARAAVGAGAPDLLQVCPENPRYFQWQGRPTILVASGEHYGAVMNLDFDFRKYLAAVEAAGLNHTRLFLGDYVERAGAFGIVDDTIAPAPGRLVVPWARSSIPGYAGGGNKFDLDRWDPEFFRRLHAFFQEAGRRRVVVEVVLFFVGPGWADSPLNTTNNVNGTTEIDGKRYLSLDNGNVLARQEAYCRKIVRELNPYGHLFFNLCNEPWFFNQERPGFVSQPPAAVKAWIRRVSEWVSDEESRLPQRHLMGVDLSNQGTVVTAEDLTNCFSALSVFSVHYDANAEVLRLNPQLPRILAFNETGFNGTRDDEYRTQGWRFLMSGGGLYGHLDFSFTVGHEDGTATPRFSNASYDGGGSAALRNQLRILLEFMHSIPFERMRPDNSIVVGGADHWHALAWADHAYALWFPGEGPIAPKVTLPKGDWRAEWVDLLSGETTSVKLSPRSWVTSLNGTRRGGGAAVRILRQSTAPKN